MIVYLVDVYECDRNNRIERDINVRRYMYTMSINSHHPR